LRLGVLRFYARREVRLLAVLFRLLNSRLMRNRVARELVYWLLVLPSARWAISGTPVAPGELEGFVRSLVPGRIAVGPCRCRLAHHACGHPLETDIVIKQGYGIWTDLFPDEYREIDADEAIGLCRGFHDAGLAQIAYRFIDVGTNDNYFVICNCCTDGCLPLLSMKMYGVDRYPFHRGALVAVVDEALCSGCGACVEICPFDGRKIVGGRAVVSDCFGCGLCATVCGSGAGGMAPREREGQTVV
jgi:NAD-dependent dihydropyrimidine dehydrogenase PreA subunit